MEAISPLAIFGAIALALGSLIVMAFLKGRTREAFVLSQLGVMVGIYIGFALGGVSSPEKIDAQSAHFLLIENFAMLGFLFAGLFAFARAPRFLGVIILLHGGFDAGHLFLEQSPAPSWYAVSCIIYDVIIGVAAILMLRRIE
ncbi:MAG: hypothetical protein AAGD92_05695 [Pseudomonadota bacterium]